MLPDLQIQVKKISQKAKKKSSQLTNFLILKTWLPNLVSRSFLFWIVFINAQDVE